MLEYLISSCMCINGSLVIHVLFTIHLHAYTHAHTHMHTVPCDQLEIPSNGKAYFSIASDLGISPGGPTNSSVRLSPGDAARFSCDGGFLLVGQSMVVCQTNGKWSAPPPTCAVGKWEEAWDAAANRCLGCGHFNVNCYRCFCYKLVLL